ncbi:MAG: hypothetical protein HQL63_01310 [Magnetococcales bacterium]|nr:hypothetical protein [Magnetococcales bacterium]MBF0322113.1 hypothetical protein [Magnetococcales bacterium]
MTNRRDTVIVLNLDAKNRKKSDRRQTPNRRKPRIIAWLTRFRYQGEERRDAKRRTRLIDRRLKQRFLELFKKRTLAGLVGLTVSPDGFGVARIVWRGEGETPILKECFFVSATASAAEGTEWFSLNQTLRARELHHGRFAGLLFPGQYALFPAEAPQVARSELASAMKWRIKDRLEFPVKEAVVEVFDLPQKKNPGQPEMVYVVAAREAVIKECFNLFHQLNLPLVAIDILELALRNLTALLPDDAEGVGLLYLGRTDGLVQVTRGGVTYLARPLDFGVDQLLESLSGRADAGEEELAASSVIDSIVLEIQRTLDYYESHFMQPSVSCVYVAPLPVVFHGLLAVLADKLGMRLKELVLSKILEVEAKIDDIDLARCLPAIGAALRQDKTK